GTGFSSLYNIADIFQRHSYSYPLYKNSEAENYARIEGRLNWIRNIVSICQKEQVPTAPGEPLADHKKPFFFWPQYFWGGYWTGSEVGRFLTYREMRYLVWGAFIEGAGGIYFWAYWHDYTNPRMNPSLWEAVRAIAHEMASLEPVLTAPDAKGIVVSPLIENKFHWRAKEYQGEIYLFAAWSGEEPLRITVSFPFAKQVDRILSWSEERVISATKNQFQDTLKKGDVAIYTTAKEGKPSKAIEFLRDPFFTEVPSYQPIPGNLAYGQPARDKQGKSIQIGATSSTSKTYHWFGHHYFAIDGDPHTCWFPLYDGDPNPSWTNPVGKDSPWLEVNFPEKKIISRIVVKSYLPKHWNDPVCNLQDYDLEYYDETGKWQTIAKIRGNKKEMATHTFDPVRTNKIRLVAYRGFFLSELEAYEK
ncbi:MAG: discoidin domain-containing protein, partial [Candidatus Omnitrophica bacterium]|nr:discoidin domain-containing protein [Candidatus Omnitrophota bacterium]